MLASKPKANSNSSGLSESPNKEPSTTRSRATSSAPRVSRLAKPAAAAGAGGPSKPAAAADRAPSPLQHASVPLDRSSASVDLPTKPSPGPPERRSLKAAAATGRTTTADKQVRSNTKVTTTELHAQLKAVQEELKNARERLAAVENDRAQVLEDLAHARRLADEAHVKLEESLAARRSAEEALELERFKSTESGVELARRKDEEWRRACDDIEKRRAEDVASATRKLDGVKEELAAAVRARDAALERAERAQGIADDNARKVEALTAEAARLRSQLETQANEAAGNITRLESEAEALRAELRMKARAFEEKLVEAEEMAEGLRVDVAYSKRAEADANRSAQEWKEKAESLEARLDDVSRLNTCNEESLASLKKSFEHCTSMLQDKESQVLQLSEKLASLEKEAAQYKGGFLETNRRLDVAKKESAELQATVDRLNSELELLHEAQRQVVASEKTVSAEVGRLTDDKNRLLEELGDARDDRDKAKKAVEDLAAALREVSSEAREAKERALAKQSELDHARLQVSELKLAMENAEATLDESRREAACLRTAVEKMGSEARTSKDEWICKEAGFVDMLKRSDDGMSNVQSEMKRLTESLRVAENEVQELKGERVQLLNKLQEFEVKARNASCNASAEEAEAETESSQLRDLLSAREEEVLALNREVTDLRNREQAALEKSTELSKLLAEVTARKPEEEEKNSEEAKALHIMKLEMDKVQESLRAAESEAKAAKGDKAQLQNKLRLLESKITEASLTSEEAKLGSLRLKETLQDRDRELASIALENHDLRAREADAQAKMYKLAALLAEAEAAAKKGGGESVNGGAVVVVASNRSPDKQPSVLRKLMCSPMHHSVVHDDAPCDDRTIQVEEIKHVEMETVKKQVRYEKERISTTEDARSLENSKIVVEEDDLPKERDDDDDSESSNDDMESPDDDDGLVDQMNGLLIQGPTSSFNHHHQQQHVHKKKKALLKKFGSLLRKKAHFTKLSNHS